jgi:hypothetical protein
MFRLMMIVLAAGALGFSSLAEAIQLPYGQTAAQPFGQWRFQDKVYGYLWINVDASGNAAVRAIFSNGRKWQGEEGLAVVVRFVNDANKKSYAVSLRTAVRGAEFHRGAREVTKVGSFRLEPGEWQNVRIETPEWTRFITDAQMNMLLTRQPVPQYDHTVFRF